MRLFLHCALAPDGAGRTRAEIESAMELEYELAEGAGEPCALLHVAQEGLSRLAAHPERWKSARAALLELCLALPRRGDLLLLEAEGDWRLMLGRASLAEAEAFAAALATGAHRLRIPGEAAPRRLALSIGLAASQPEQELAFETLVRVAREGAELASLSGDGRVVHTQLYALQQRQLERERPGLRVPSKARRSAATQAQGAPHAGHASAAQPAGSGAARPERAIGPDAGELDARIGELAEERVRAVLAGRLAELEAAHTREVELYERRIAKLNQELALCEESLRNAARGLPAEAGLASVFRSVQGLDPAEQRHAAKLSLLGEILEANLLLRSALEARRTGTC